MKYVVGGFFGRITVLFGNSMSSPTLGRSPRIISTHCHGLFLFSDYNSFIGDCDLHVIFLDTRLVQNVCDKINIFRIRTHFQALPENIWGFEY